MPLSSPAQADNVPALIAHPITDFDAGLLFSGTASGRQIRGFTAPSPLTPALDPDYLFHDRVREVIAWFMAPSDPLYVFGPTGSGKTSLIRQIAARLNYPVYEVTAHGRLEFDDLVGHLTLSDNSMRYAYGPLALAMQHGGLFLLNEMDLLDPAVAAGLNGILDGGSLCLTVNGGESIPPHPMFRFIATANSNGASDESGLYQGVLRQNLAFMDRFQLCEVDYPSTDAEQQILQRCAPDLPHELRQGMIDYACEVRRLFIGSHDAAAPHRTLDVTFSTRTLIRWADLTLRFQPLARQGIQPLSYALDRALAYRASPSTRALLHEIAQRLFGGAVASACSPTQEI